MRLSRRQLVQSAGIAAGALMLPATVRGQATPAPSRGGELRAAFVGAGQMENLSPWEAGYHVAAFQRSQALYEPLVRNSYGSISGVLAETLEPNADGSRWQIKLRSGVTFHDGSPLTAADVIGTWSYHLDPANASIYGLSLGLLDLANTTVVDELTIDLALVQPLGDLPDYLAGGWVFIFKENPGDLSMTANGTGPFKLESFSPGDRAVLTRNEAYWGPAEKGPFLDRLELLSIDDEQTRINAVLGGQIEYADSVSPVLASTLVGDARVQLFRPDNPVGNAVHGFTVNVNSAPFNDARVREGLRLLVDREALIASVGNGFGRLANDILASPRALFNQDLPQREHDPERAAALFAEAGAEGAEFELWTSAVAAGYVEAATLWTDQLERAGFRPQLTVLPSDTYFVDFAAVIASPMKTNSGGAGSVPSIISAYYLSTAYLNMSGYNNPRVDQLYDEARASLDPAIRAAKFAEIEYELWLDGPDVAWGELDTIHVTAPNVAGIDASDTNLYPLFTSAHFIAE